MGPFHTRNPSWRSSHLGGCGPQGSGHSSYLPLPAALWSGAGLTGGAMEEQRCRDPGCPQVGLTLGQIPSWGGAASSPRADQWGWVLTDASAQGDWAMDTSRNWASGPRVFPWPATRPGSCSCVVGRVRPFSRGSLTHTAAWSWACAFGGSLPCCPSTSRATSSIAQPLQPIDGADHISQRPDWDNGRLG